MIAGSSPVRGASGATPGADASRSLQNSAKGLSARIGRYLGRGTGGQPPPQPWSDPWGHGRGPGPIRRTSVRGTPVPPEHSCTREDNPERSGGASAQRAQRGGSVLRPAAALVIHRARPGVLEPTTPWTDRAARFAPNLPPPAGGPLDPRHVPLALTVHPAPSPPPRQPAALAAPDARSARPSRTSTTADALPAG